MLVDLFSKDFQVSKVLVEAQNFYHNYLIDYIVDYLIGFIIITSGVGSNKK